MGVIETLREQAICAMGFSYAPYSKFHVGAAVMDEDGKIFTGCNIENASYGATICAERTAILKAVSEGHQNLKEIMIVCDGEQFPYPCGMCLQVMSEFMPDGLVHVVNGDEIKTFTLKELMPHAFDL